MGHVYAMQLICTLQEARVVSAYVLRIPDVSHFQYQATWKNFQCLCQIWSRYFILRESSPQTLHRYTRRLISTFRVILGACIYFNHFFIWKSVFWEKLIEYVLITSITFSHQQHDSMGDIVWKERYCFGSDPFIDPFAHFFIISKPHASQTILHGSEQVLIRRRYIWRTRWVWTSHSICKIASLTILAKCGRAFSCKRMTSCLLTVIVGDCYNTS